MRLALVALALTTALVSTAAAGPARADVAAVLDRHILPGTAAFAQATVTLDTAAAADCAPDALRPAWNAAVDAWMGIAHLRLGPQEQAALTIAYWPDDRGAGRRTLARLIAAQDPMGLDIDAFAQISVAARGLFALETMLYDPAFDRYAPASYACALVAVMANDLATQAQTLDTAWRQQFAPLLRDAGAPDNATFLSVPEAQRALFTQLMTGVEVIADQRLARPMGTPDQPRPQRAENWRSGRGLRNVTLSLDALRAMAEALSDTPMPGVDQAFDAAAYAADGVVDPGFQDVTNPLARMRLESLQRRVQAIRPALDADLGTALGIASGFNALDGD